MENFKKIKTDKNARVVIIKNRNFKKHCDLGFKFEKNCAGYADVDGVSNFSYALMGEDDFASCRSCKNYQEILF